MDLVTPDSDGEPCAALDETTDIEAAVSNWAFHVIADPVIPSDASPPGGRRSRSANKTLSWTKNIVPKVGNTRVVDISGLEDLGIFVCRGVRPDTRSISISAGASTTLAAAKAAAVMESLELWHAEHAALPTLSFDPVSPPEGIHLIEWRKLFNSCGNGLANPPKREIPWVCGWDLISNRACWVPLETVIGDVGLPAPLWSGVFSSSSTGLASGNNLVEAILYGVYEVAERDAVSKWLQLPLDQRRATRIKLGSIVHSDAAAIVEKLQTAGVGVMAWNATPPGGVPTIIVGITNAEVFVSSFVPGTMGFGTHLSPSVALLSAVNESVQTRLLFLAGERDEGALPTGDFQAGNQSGFLADELQMEQQIAIAPDPVLAPTLNEELADVIGALSTMASQIVAVNLTRDDVGAPVAKLIAPGLLPGPS